MSDEETTKRIRIPSVIPRDYQLPFFKAMDSGVKRAVLVWHRRSGKEVACFNWMIKQACTDRVGTYVYFFPTSTLGRRILWDGANKDGKRFLDYIPQELIAGNINSNEMKVKLTNGSIIQIIGSDQIINVGINPIGCVFSEFSLQDPKCWNFIRPILRENDGWAVFNFCVTKDTWVITKSGLRQIGSFDTGKKGFSKLQQDIYGLGGFHRATEFYSGGTKKVLTITTKKGYAIRCTPNHPLWDGKVWKKSEELVIGDNIPIQLDQDVFSAETLDITSWIRPQPKSRQGKWKSIGDNFLSLDFFYLMGLYLADGSSGLPSPVRGASLTITKTDLQIIEFLNGMGFKTQKDGIHHVYSGTELHSFFMWFGLTGTAKEKTLPDKLLQCRKEEIIAFLQGYFDGDGTASKKESGQIKVTSGSEKLLSSLHVLLLNFGIVCRKSTAFVPPTNRVKVYSTIYNLETEGHFAYRFFDRIGFRLDRKQGRSNLLSEKIKKYRGDMVPTDPGLLGGYPLAKVANPKRVGYRKLHELNAIQKNPYIEKLIEDGFYWDEIKSIEEGEEEVVDFVIPETHSFFSNGFVSHNTPRGKNAAYDLFLMAQNNPDWFCQKLTIHDTGVLTSEDLDIERAEGMSEHLIQQEFLCNFDQGSEGAYYAKYLNKAELDGRITHVPYDPHAPVDTYWDLGVSDETVILLAQNIGNEIHIINMYRNQGEGLQHYARWIQTEGEKHEYVYGEHYAPHDIQVRELGSGAQTRLQIAKDLGISFKIVPNIPIHEGIELVRGIFPRLWVDSEKCSFFIKAIESYHKSFNERLNVYSDKPRHDWSSHVADSFRYLAVSQNKKRKSSMSEEEANEMERAYSFRHV